MCFFFLCSFGARLFFCFLYIGQFYCFVFYKCQHITDRTAQYNTRNTFVASINCHDCVLQPLFLSLSHFVCSSLSHCSFCMHTYAHRLFYFIFPSGEHISWRASFILCNAQEGILSRPTLSRVKVMATTTHTHTHSLAMQKYHTVALKPNTK